ncbi:MAG: hypothetical protein Q8Q00_11160 [Dehalococcoidia bacterium]|nr:hypothetical protein [Dehalococcoidia bacterium]
MTGSTVTPAPTATAVPVVIDEVWAAEQVMPVLKTGLELARDQEWSKFYDGMSADSKTRCSRTEFVTNMTGTWILAVGFGVDKILEAELQDIEDGTLRLSFSEISAERITYKATPDDDPTTVVLEDGEWHNVDDGTCGKATEDTPTAQ